MKVALVQHGFKGSKSETIKKSLEFIKKAKKDGAELIVLQELHQDRYFCINENVDNFDLAESYEKDLEFWSKVSKENKIVIIASLFEKRTTGLYHNTVTVFETDGTIAGKYRKMHIPDDPGFYEKFYFTPGDLGYEPISTSVGKLGVLICWDQWFPEAARLMALKGAEILIYPTAIGWFDDDSDEEKAKQLDSWITIQRSHAISNGLPVISVNRVGKELDDSKAIDGIRFWGNSFAVDAQGSYICKLGENEEVNVIDIDMKANEDIRRIWPFLRDRRIDSYKDLIKRFID